MTTQTAREYILRDLTTGDYFTGQFRHNTEPDTTHDPRCAAYWTDELEARAFAQALERVHGIPFRAVAD